MEDSPGDIELMIRLQSGDDLALNELMARWQQPLASFIYRYVGSQAEAIDLAQETFVRVFESRHRYKPSAKFSTWLFTIASNLCRNLFRWRQRHPTVALDAPLSDRADSSNLTKSLADEADTPADTAERNDVAAAVKDEIDRLPHDLKTAVLLFEYEDLSHQEIAVVLRCSSKAVETRLYRARNILRGKLASFQMR